MIEQRILQYKPESFCHNDLHYRNLVKSDSGIKIIDFDHANYGYRAYDIAYWLTHAGHKRIEDFINRRNDQMNQLIHGYIDLTREDTFDSLYTEICDFLPYTILDHFMVKKPNDTTLWKNNFRNSLKCHLPK